MRQMIQRAVFSELGKFGTEDVYGDIVVLATANLGQSVASVVMGLDALLGLVPLPSADGYSECRTAGAVFQ